MPTYIAKLFYLGSAYHGSQWQPNVRTIQGELVNAFSTWTGKEYTHESIVLSGRTDRGVSSLGQIVRFTTDKRPKLEKINAHLPDDISLWAISEVSSDYNPRYSVLFRHYRYYLDISGLNLNLSNIRRAQRYLIGSHNYALLSKPDADRNTLTTILNITSRRNETLLIFDFYGISFLWKLVRKTITLLKWIGLGLYPPEIISDLLNGKNMISGGIEPAPPEGLVFIEAIIPIRMKPDFKSIKRMQKAIKKWIRFYRRTTTMLEEFNHDYFFDSKLSY